MALLSSGHDIIEENERKIFENIGIHASAWTKFWPLGSWSNYFCSEWADNYEGLTEQRFNVPMLWESRELPTRCLISIWILMNMNRDWLFFFVIKFLVWNRCFLVMSVKSMSHSGPFSSSHFSLCKWPEVVTCP